MRALVLVLLLGSAVATADELPPNSCGIVGADCTLDDGTPGTCIEERHEYVDDDGVKQSWTEAMCRPLVSTAQRSVLPWLGLGLAFIALCAALATRPAPASARRPA